MAKIKRPGKKKTPTTQENVVKALPCLFVVLGGIAILAVLFYYSLASTAK